MPSTVIKSFRYDPERKMLEIVFITGRRYVYDAVPPAVVEALTKSSSKGGFFNRRIRSRFSFRELDA